MINLRLTLLFFLLQLAFILCGTDVYAQEVKAMPVAPVQQETIPGLGKAPIVVELFSSQACVFCPKADRLFADILQQDNVVGLACHVDYFDVEKGSLSRSFCTERQNFYMQALAAGPNYTPQIVINGATDVVGYKLDNVIKALQEAIYSDVLPLQLAETKARGTWKVILPIAELPQNQNLRLWMALYDKPHHLTIAEGRNKGKQADYYNIVSSLGSTAKLAREVFVTPPIEDRHAGFVLILQDMQTGKIYGVARHKITSIH